MILNSKFDIGEEVFFYNEKKMKLDKGTVYKFDVSVVRDKKPKYRYFIEMPKKEGQLIADLAVAHEQFVFKSRDEAMEFALSFAADI